MSGVLVGVLVNVGVLVGVLVAVLVGVSVGVLVAVLVGVLVGVSVGLLVGVSVGVFVGGAHVPAVIVQLVLLPESVLLEALTAVALTLLESLTSRKVVVRVPCGSILHCVPVTSLRSASSDAQALPCNVSAPTIVWVLLDWK